MEVTILLMTYQMKYLFQTEAKDENLGFFKMIPKINEAKALTKRILCEYKCKFDGRKFNSNQKWNNDKCWCEYKNSKNYHVCKKRYAWVFVLIKIINI